GGAGGVAEAGRGAAVRGRVEPAVEQARRRGEVRADLAVARSEALVGIAARDPHPHTRGALGDAERPGRAEELVFGSHHHVGDVGGALEKACPSNRTRGRVLPGDVESHVERSDRHGDVDVEVLGDTVGEVEGADRVGEVGPGLVTDLRPAADRDRRLLHDEPTAVRAVDLVVAEGDRGVQEAGAHRLPALGEEEGRHGIVDSLEGAGLRVPAIRVSRRRGREEGQVAHRLLEDHVGGVVVALAGEAGQSDECRRGAVGAADRLRRGRCDGSQDDGDEKRDGHARPTYGTPLPPASLVSPATPGQGCTTSPLDRCSTWRRMAHVRRSVNAVEVPDAGRAVPRAAPGAAAVYGAPARTVACGRRVLPGIAPMAISKELLDILVCPVSKGALELTADGKFLVCRESKLVYRIEDDIPIMLADE